MKTAIILDRQWGNFIRNEKPIDNLYRQDTKSTTPLCPSYAVRNENFETNLEMKFDLYLQLLAVLMSAKNVQSTTSFANEMNFNMQQWHTLKRIDANVKLNIEKFQLSLPIGMLTSSLKKKYEIQSTFKLIVFDCSSFPGTFSCGLLHPP